MKLSIGSFIAGTSFFSYQSAGSWTALTPAAVGKVRTEQGLAAGGTFMLAPGAYVFLSYLYGTRHQTGVDLLSGVATATGAPSVTTNNNTRAQMVMLGTQFRW